MANAVFCLMHYEMEQKWTGINFSASSIETAVEYSGIQSRPGKLRDDFGIIQTYAGKDVVDITKYFILLLT